MDKRDQFFTLTIIILVSIAIWLAVETKTSRDYIIENEAAIAELRVELDRAEMADNYIIHWMRLTEEWMIQMLERLDKKPLY